MKDGIKSVIARAIDHEGTAGKLAASLYEKYGVEKLGKPYDQRTVSTWARPNEDTMPPALALLGAAALANLSLDELIHGETIRGRQEEHARLLAELAERQQRQGELLTALDKMLREPGESPS